MKVQSIALTILLTFIAGGLISAYGKKHQGYDFVEEYHNRTCYFWKAPKRKYCEWR